MTQAELASAARLKRLEVVRTEGGHYPRSGSYNALVHALGFTSGQKLYDEAGLGKREKFVSAARTAARSCESCGASIAPSGAGRGRPRKRCASCAADRSALGRAWRAANPNRVAAYNASRRQAVRS